MATKRHKDGQCMLQCFFVNFGAFSWQSFWGRKSGMVKDALDSAGVNLGGKAETVIMIKCRECGQLDEEDSKFCQECGAKL